MSTLFDYDEREAPTVKQTPRRQVPVPAPDMDGIAGVLGVLESGEKVYVTPRTRSQHFFRKHAGYAVSDRILAELDRQGVVKVFVQETDVGDVIEYDTAQFSTAGIDVDYEDGDPQTLVPEAVARVWDGHSEEIL